MISRSSSSRPHCAACLQTHTQPRAKKIFDSSALELGKQKTLHPTKPHFGPTTFPDWTYSLIVLMGMHLLSFYLFLSLWVHPSPLSPPSIGNHSPLPSLFSSVLPPFLSPFFCRFPDQYVLSFLLQAWLTEIHEYAQQDVVVMLLGNKVRPCCQHWEMDGQMDS